MSIPTFPTGLTGPATHAFAITPDDVDAQPDMKALRADAAGAVTLRMKDSPADVTLNLAAGEYVIGLITHVRDTGTDAVALHGFA